MEDSLNLKDRNLDF